MDSSGRLARLANIHGNLVSSVFPHGARLSCRVCGNTRTATRESCADYFKNGWPTCCHHGMTIDKIDATTTPAPADGEG